MRQKRLDGLGVRWTIGDVTPLGFEALRLSLWGAYRIFGPDAEYAVYVNTIGCDRAKDLVGDYPADVAWHDVAKGVPPFLAARLDPAMAEGVAWKFAPLQAFPDRYELSLDNDCILWERPAAIDNWLTLGGCLLAEDVKACFGRFASVCGDEPRNTGIRGLPPKFDLAACLGAALDRDPGPLVSELDEQGLQVAALSHHSPWVVGTSDVCICSPFPPHVEDLGRCGAHFVGINRKRVGWSVNGRPAEELLIDNWWRHRRELHSRVGIEPRAAGMAR
jgi:hypothetical protein